MKRRVFAAAALALLAALMVRWWWPAGVPETDRPSPPDPRFDYVLGDFHARFYDDKGHLDLELRGPRLEHTEAARQALIIDPDFRIRSDDAVWDGHARSALLQRESDHLTLERDVVVTRPHPRGPVTIRSERIDYDRAAGRIHAPDRARVTQAGTELTGGTLTVWIEDERMELDNHVEAIYRPGGAAGADLLDDRAGDG